MEVVHVPQVLILVPLGFVLLRITLIVFQVMLAVILFKTGQVHVPGQGIIALSPGILLELKPLR